MDQFTTILFSCQDDKVSILVIKVISPYLIRNQVSDTLEIIEDLDYNKSSRYDFTNKPSIKLGKRLLEKILKLINEDTKIAKGLSDRVS